MRPTMAMTGLLALPEGCIVDIISLTSPPDACRLACVSTAYRSTVDSDPVWARFLPPQYLAAISESAFLSKKQLYLQACHNPVLINDGNLSFWLDKPSGKKCYMIAARELTIVWGDTPEFWGWIQLPEARFPEVAELRYVCWFDISGKISTSILSPRTTYVFYLVFKPVNHPFGFENYRNGFENNPVKVTIELAHSGGQTRSVYLDTTERRFPSDEGGSFPEERGDGWFESELGECFYGGDEDGELSMTIMETERGLPGNWKTGLVFQGIEIRPKREQMNN